MATKSRRRPIRVRSSQGFGKLPLPDTWQSELLMWTRDFEKENFSLTRLTYPFLFILFFFCRYFVNHSQPTTQCMTSRTSKYRYIFWSITSDWQAILGNKGRPFVMWFSVHCYLYYYLFTVSFLPKTDPFARCKSTTKTMHKDIDIFSKYMITFNRVLKCLFLLLVAYCVLLFSSIT